MKQSRNNNNNNQPKRRIEKERERDKKVIWSRYAAPGRGNSFKKQEIREHWNINKRVADIYDGHQSPQFSWFVLFCFYFILFFSWFRLFISRHFILSSVIDTGRKCVLLRPKCKLSNSNCIAPFQIRSKSNSSIVTSSLNRSHQNTSGRPPLGWLMRLWDFYSACAQNVWAV